MSDVDVKPPRKRVNAPPVTPLDEALRERVRATCEEFRSCVLAELTGFSEESIRRYMKGHKPAAVFLARLCHAFEISPAWMLLGRDGPLLSRTGAPTLDEEEVALNKLAAHMTELRREVDLVAPPTDGTTRGGKRHVRVRAPEVKSMETRKVRELRLLLGPADGHTVPIEQIMRVAQAVGDEIVIRLDAKHPRAWLVAPDEEMEPAAKTHRYRKVMHEVYRWINPAPEPG